MEKCQSQSILILILSIVNIKSIWLFQKGDKLGISGDMKGDGFQNGGALIVDKGGKQLYEYRQEDAAEHISDEEILKALKLSKN